MPFQQNEMPGFQTAIESEEAQVYFGGTKDETQLSVKPFLMDSTAVDAANTPTTTIRGGTIMVKNDVDGLIYPYGQKTGVIVGILPSAISTIVEGTATDRWVHVFTSGLLKAAELRTGTVAANTTISSLYPALEAMGFILDTPQAKSVAAIYHFRVAAADADASDDDGVATIITDAGDGTATTLTKSTTPALVDPDVPRCLSITVDDVTGDGADIKASTVVVTGTDYYDNVITEDFTITANTEETVDGTKAFKTVTSIVYPAQDSPYDVTFTAGWCDKFGLHHCLTRDTVMTAQTFLGGTVEGTEPTVTTSATAISSNTILLNSAADGSQIDSYYIIDNSD